MLFARELRNRTHCAQIIDDYCFDLKIAMVPDLELGKWYKAVLSDFRSAEHRNLFTSDPKQETTQREVQANAFYSLYLSGWVDNFELTWRPAAWRARRANVCWILRWADFTQWHASQTNSSCNLAWLTRAKSKNHKYRNASKKQMDHTVILSVALPVVLPQLLILLVLLVRAPLYGRKRIERGSREGESDGIWEQCWQSVSRNKKPETHYLAETLRTRRPPRANRALWPCCPPPLRCVGGVWFDIDCRFFSFGFKKL